jgi:hypothetical protein
LGVAWESADPVVDVFVAWFGAALVLVLVAAELVAPGGGTELSSDGISGAGGAGLATTGVGVGIIKRWNIEGRSVGFDVLSLLPVPWRLREAQIMTSFSTRWSL